MKKSFIFFIFFLASNLFAKEVILIVTSSIPIYEQNEQYVTKCYNDSSSNALGTISGAAIGGILASNIGKGSGKNAAIILASLSGAYAGNQIQKASKPSSCVQEKVSSSSGRISGYKNIAYYNNKEYYTITKEAQRKILINID